MKTWWRLARVVLFALLTLLWACADEVEPETDPDLSQLPPGGKADIYGTDDRREIFDAEAVYQGVAESSALVVSSSEFYLDGSQRRWLTDASWSERIDASLGAPLCSAERFRSQPAPGYCSAFLVAPDLVATAGHCINLRYTCQNIRFVFGYQYESSADERDVRKVEDDDFYRCAGVIGHVYDKDAVSMEAMMLGEYWSDWAVIKLDRPVVGRTPLELRRSGEIEEGARIDAIGYPGGIPAKVTGGHVVDNDPSLYFNTDLDIYGGNSGGVVVNTEGVVEGIVIRGTGGDSFSRQGSCYVSDACANYSPSRREGCTGNHVMRINPVLQFVDAEYFVAKTSNDDIKIPNGSGSATYTFTVDDPGVIRYLTLNTIVDHDNPKELEITVERDTGHSATLFHKPELQKVWLSRSTDEFNGEPANGTWTVRVKDLKDNFAWSQEAEFAQLIIGIGVPVEPEPEETFVGSPCADDEACTFAEDAFCQPYDDQGTQRGFCTLSCEGTCPDRAGFATTFCGSLDGGLSGLCLSKAHADNGYCDTLPGTVQMGVARYTGESSTSESTANACVPEFL